MPFQAVCSRGRSPCTVGLLPACLGLLLVFWPPVARAHDPSAWGGLFRSRDGGATWFPANPGRFVSGALALAISPRDVNHLLLATDSGLLRSQNGGRDWDLEAPSVLVGPVFAVAFDADGERVLVSTSSGIFVRETGQTWLSSPAGAGVAPARALVRGAVAGRAYLAGWRGFLRSDDWGRSWSHVGEGLPEASVTALVVTPGPPEILYAVAAGRVWSSSDGARTWRSSERGMAPGRVDALVIDPQRPLRLWATSGQKLFHGGDRGERWLAIGQPLGEPNTSIRGIAVSESGREIVLSTDRGLYRSIDRGGRWDLLVDSNLPVHLEAGPLVRDPRDASTLYAGFALRPYDELWQSAAEGRPVFSRLDAVNLGGGVAFLLIVGIGAAAALRRAARYYRAAAVPPKRRLLTRTPR